MGILTKMRLAKMSFWELIDKQLKIYYKYGFCRAYRLINRELSRRVTTA